MDGSKQMTSGASETKAQGEAEQGFAIDMSTHFDVDKALEDLAKARFSMPPVVVAAFRQAAQISAMKLLTMVADPKFDKLSVNAKLRIMDMIFDRAYGKSETASTAALAEHKTGGGEQRDKGKHAEQLDAIAARATAASSTRRQPAKLSSPRGDSFDDGGDGSLTSMPRPVYPELAGKRSRGSAQGVAREERGESSVVPITSRRSA